MLKGSDVKKKKKKLQMQPNFQFGIQTVHLHYTMDLFYKERWFK